MNGEEAMISEAHMNRFFPNKLTKYYKNLINAMTSTYLVPTWNLYQLIYFIQYNLVIDGKN